MSLIASRKRFASVILFAVFILLFTYSFISPAARFGAAAIAQSQADDSENPEQAAPLEKKSYSEDDEGDGADPQPYDAEDDMAPEEE